MSLTRCSLDELKSALGDLRNQPKTWEELLNAGYVMELDECQIAEAKDKLNPVPFKDFYSEQELKTREFILNTNESRLRGL